METVTYNLHTAEDNGSSYYDDIRTCTDTVMEASGYLEEIIIAYKDYIRDNKIEESRTNGEYFFEMLSLGVFYNCYHKNAFALSSLFAYLLKGLYKLRSNFNSIKPPVDFTRGILSTVFLKRKIKKDILPSLPGFEKLLLWLEASGEFEEDVKRAKIITAFLRSLKENKAASFANRIASFALWFESAAANYLSIYTSYIKDYMEMQYSSHKWREDYIFCGRMEVEYHLSMVGAEIMNRAFRSRFAETDSRTLLLPACMRILPDGKCKAEKVDIDMNCTGCSPNCNVNRYRLLGIDNSFNVRIIPHSSGFTKWLEKWAAGKNTGVIGVACPLNLIKGGYELKGLNIPAQCVPLDYCGCVKHWDAGIPTDMNKNELMNILENVISS